MRYNENKYNFTLNPMSEIYYNEDSFYGIYKFSTGDKIPNLEELKFTSGQSGVSTIVGKMQRLTIGVPYECNATLVLNKKYNKYQYEVDSISANKPKTLNEQEQFLKCILTEGQTKALLGVYPNIIEMILDNKDVSLDKVKGIGNKSFEKIKNKILDNYVLSDIITMLKPYGITINAIKSLIKEEKNTVLLKQKLKENPYLLTSISGFGFKRIDLIALQINPCLKNSSYRLKSFISYYLSDIGNNDGHSKIQLSSLTDAVKSNVFECFDLYNKLIEKEMCHPNFLYIDSGCVGLYSYYKRENDINYILKTLESSSGKDVLSDGRISQIYNKFKCEKGYDLTSEQKEILHAMNNHNVVLLTGKAGSGKSSAIDVVIKAYSNKNISLTALSAKAVRRMVETTGVEDCKTIHRLLGYQGSEFLYTKDNPLPTDVLIIDEASMINSSLFLSLLSAISTDTKVLIVFDDGQLPPIGVGNIAKDLLELSFKHISLTKVHRQAQDSGILSDANIIREGSNPIQQPSSKLCRGKLKDMYYIFDTDKQAIFDTTIKYYIKSLDSLSVDDITIIVPRKGNAINSTASYNDRIQSILLKDVKKFVKKGDKVFKLGAKLIQRANNKDKNVVNGEIGFLTNINPEGFEVSFDNKVVSYTITEMDELELAYALTVHLMQGSQCDTIIFVCDSSSYILLSKELVYTALTRASKRCLVISEPRSFNIGCKKKAGARNTWLKDMLVSS
ncbi:MAG: AAA family ATPase [Clostridium sp.]